MNPEKSVEIELNQIAINIVSKHLPTDPRRGLERSIAEALSTERKKVEESERKYAVLLTDYDAAIKARDSVTQDRNELIAWRFLAEKMKEALEFCLNKEVFPQGVCDADKETEAYTRANQALSDYNEMSNPNPRK